MPMRFVPKRSTQHRIACIALYRLLYRQALKIAIPKDFHLPLLASEYLEHRSKSSKLLVPSQERNPIRALVTRQFRRNRHDTSPRLIHAALTSGYKFVDLLAKAQDSSSPEHEQVIDYLDSHPPKPPKEPKIKPVPRPLLLQIPPRSPGGMPSYVPAERPLPLSSLKGKRGIPRLCSTSHGFPFLRLGKPQSPILSNMLRYKSLQFEDRAQYKEAADEATDDAIEEDMWDKVVENLLVTEGIKTHEDAQDSGSYLQTLEDGEQLVKAEMDWERKDNINRARALMKLMLEEEKLAKAEALERNPRLPPKLLGL
ncbi:bZIP transcription factor [Ceratocystis lukuohia]|uniref:BZIP transcription factor n=1 Tax=Ceratocystis lukuohia TaxID=2019550 RepID=A0ABR4MR93_9PEZI